MAGMREVDGALQIASRGRPLGEGIILAVWAAGMELAAWYVPGGQWLLHLFSAAVAVLAVFFLIASAAVDRVIIDPRTRRIVVGETATPWSDYAAVLPMEVVVAGGEETEYTVWLVRADGSGRVRVAHTTIEWQSTKLAKRVAGMLGVPLLATERG